MRWSHIEWKGNLIQNVNTAIAGILHNLLPHALNLPSVASMFIGHAPILPVSGDVVCLYNVTPTLSQQNSGMTVVNNQYQKNVHWKKITYLGSGAAGKCSLCVDLNTEAQFAVKKVVKCCMIGLF